MTLKWIRRWARFLDVKLRLDHTLSQSTDKLRSDNSLFQIVLIERGFVIQSIILLYINPKGTAVSPAIPTRFFKTSAKDTKNTPSILVIQISVIHQFKLWSVYFFLCTLTITTKLCGFEKKRKQTGCALCLFRLRELLFEIRH